MNCDEVWMWLQRELLTRTEKNPSRMHGPIAATSLISFNAAVPTTAAKRQVHIVRRREQKGGPQQVIVQRMWIHRHEANHETIWTMAATRDGRGCRFMSGGGETLTATEFRDRILQASL